MLQAATLKAQGKKKQWRRAESEESDDVGGDPDSDRSFTLATLDCQSFMCKITLWIIQAAISHIGYNNDSWYTLERCHQQRNYNIWTLCFSSENLFHFTVKRDRTNYSVKPADYVKFPLFLEEKASSAYLNDFFCYIMRKVGEWWVARCVNGWHGWYLVLVHKRWRQHWTQQGPVRHKCLQVRPSAGSQRSHVQALCGLPGVLCGCFNLPQDYRSAGL